ncbi:MAG TPA: hypothetical protein VF132_10255, partial [Rudaea sp.]
MARPDWKRFFVSLLLALAAGTAAAADVAIYDEALENAFSTGYSYDPDGHNVVTVGSTDAAHTGTHSIKFVGSDYGALAFTHATTFSTTDYPILHFWIYGAAPGAQDLMLQIYADKDSGASSAEASLSNYITGGAVGNGVWREVTVPLTLPPLSFTGTFDRIDLQSEAGGATQAAVYLDDIALQSVIDPIFKNGFDASTPPPTLGPLVQDTITLDSVASDRFTWYDSAGQPRVAVLAHNDAGTATGGSHGGELRQFRYQAGASQRIVSAPGRADGGFGYIVSHPRSESICVGGDSSTLGHFVAGTWTRIFTGRHHAIFRFQQNYPRYCSTSGPAAEHDIPVTIDWVFSTGRDHPLWSVTYDMHLLAANILDDDSRAPYGTLNIDGSSGTYMDNDVGGIAWGDRYRFTTTGAATLSGPWSWTAPNTIPFVELWTSGVDATMGLAQTQTMTQQDAGGGRKPYGAGSYDVSAYWTQASPAIACPNGAFDGQTGQAHSLPCVQHWPYQANSFSYGSITETTNDAKMTWGTQYGFLGQSAYALNDSTLAGGGTAAGYPRRSYSVFVIFGTHSGDPVGAQVAQMEAIQATTL